MRWAFARAAIAVAALGLASAATAGEAGGADDARVVKRTYRFEWKAPFADMSPQGKAIIAEAMKRERIPANAEEVRRARQRVLELLSAEKLDVGAIRKAQAKEREVALKEHELSQDKMLRAYQQLSLADRRAFAAGLRIQEQRMTQHMLRARERMRLMEQQMERDVERVKKETGQLWIIVPPAAPLLSGSDGQG